MSCQAFFERVAPQRAGAKGEEVKALLSELMQEAWGVHGTMILTKGKVIGEAWRDPYQPGCKRAMFSVSKSFTAMAIGIAAEEGHISLGDKVVSFFSDLLPSAPCENMEKMTVEHLLMMAPGFDASPHDFKYPRRSDVRVDFAYMYEDFRIDHSIDWTKDVLRSYVARAPGERFVYSNGCTYLLSVILERATGESLLDYLTPRLFEPLGIEKPIWQTSYTGEQVGGWGLWLTLEDLAKFTHLLMQKGMWEGQRLIPEYYVEAATKEQIPIGNPAAKWETGFGYQIWNLGNGAAYAGIGAFGQLYVVYPEYDTAVLMIGGSNKYMRTLDVIMERIPKLFSGQDGVFDVKEPLLLRAGTPVPVGVSSWDKPLANRYSGRYYIFSDNYLGITSMRFHFGPEDRLELGLFGTKTTLPIGYETFAYGKTGMATSKLTDAHMEGFYEKVAIVGAWDEDVYRMRIVFLETPYVHDMKCFFTDHGLVIRNLRNVTMVYSINEELIGMWKG